MNDASLRLSVSTKLSQGYKGVAPVTNCQEMQLLRTTDGASHLAALNEEHEVWLLSDAEQTESGNVMHRINMVSTALALASGSDGQVLLFGAAANTLYYSRQFGGQMDGPHTLPIPPPEGTSAIEQIIPAVFGQTYYLMVFYRIKASQQLALTFVQLSASDMTPFYVHTAVQVASVCGTWTGSEENPAFLAYTGQKLLRYDSNELEWFVQKLEESPSLKQLESVLCADESEELYALTDDGKIQQILSDGTLRSLSAESNEQIQSFAVFLRDGQIHFFAQSGGHLWHCQGPHGEALSAFMIIQKNISGFIFDHQHQDQVGLVVEQTNRCQKNAHGLYQGHDSGLAFFYEEPQSQDWSKRAVLSEHSDEFWAYNAYVSELAFTDEEGKGAGHYALEIWTNEYCELVINEHTYHLSPEHKAVVKTDPLGKLRLSQSAVSLDACDILFRPAKSNDEKCYVLSLNKNFRDQLSTISGEDLLKAVKGNGEPLIHGEYRQQETLDEVAKALRHTMSATVNDASGLKGQLMKDSLLRDIQSDDIRCFASDPGQALFQLPAPSRAGHFELSFEQNHICCRQLSQEEAALLTAGTSDGFFSFFKDLFKAIIQGVVKVVKIIVNAAEEAIKMTFHVVSEGLKKIADFTISTIKEVSQVVGAIFETIKNTFEDIIDWLGYLFDWKDIKNTANHLKERIVPALEQFERLLAQNQSRCHQTIIGAKDQMDQFLQDMVKKIDPEHTFIAQKPSQEHQAAFTNNILLDRTVAGSSGVQLSANFLLKQQDVDIIQQFIDDMEPLVTDSAQNLSQMLQSLSSVLSGERVLQNLLCAVIEGFKLIADGVLDACVVVIDALFGIVRALLGMLKSAFLQPLYIPFVTAFLKRVCGVEITILDAAVYIAAIPATILCKAISGHAPFAAKNALGDPIVDVVVSMSLSCAFSGLAEIVNAVLDGFKWAEIQGTFVSVLEIISAVFVLLWMIFDTDVASPGQGLAITALILGLLQLILSAATGILRLAGQLTWPPNDHLTKWEKLQAVCSGIMGVIAIIVGGFYVDAVWDEEHCAATRALLCMGSVVSGLSGTLQLGRLCRVSSPVVYGVCVVCANLVDTAIAVAYGVVAGIEAGHQKKETSDEAGRICRVGAALQE